MCRSQIQGQNSFNFEQLRPRPPLAVATLVGSYGCPDTSYTLQVQPPTLPVLLCAFQLCMLILHFARPDNSNTLRWPCWVCRCLQFAIFTLVVFRKLVCLLLINCPPPNFQSSCQWTVWSVWHFARTWWPSKCGTAVLKSLKWKVYNKQFTFEVHTGTK